MDQICILLVWSGSRFNSGFTFKSSQGWCVERSPNSCSASSQRTPCPNSTTKQSLELFWVWLFLPHQLSNRSPFKASLMEPFISWQTSMLFSWKLSKALLQGFTSPICQVLYVSLQLLERKPSTKTTHTLMMQASSWWQRKPETWPPKNETW